MRDIEPTVIDALDAGVPAVRAFREARWISIAGLASGSGIRVERIEANDVGATPTSLETAAIAAALGVDETDLIAGLE